jgi:hexokinase
MTWSLILRVLTVYCRQCSKVVRLVGMYLQGVNASIEALVNDTVGVLCATRYTSGPDANIAVIMGTGTNACYVEQIYNIEKYKSKYLPRTQDMVVRSPIKISSRTLTHKILGTVELRSAGQP